jgi:hypothetical protein
VCPVSLAQLTCHCIIYAVDRVRTLIISLIHLKSNLPLSVHNYIILYFSLVPIQGFHQFFKKNLNIYKWSFQFLFLNGEDSKAFLAHSFRTREHFHNVCKLDGKKKLNPSTTHLVKLGDCHFFKSRQTSG